MAPFYKLLELIILNGECSWNYSTVETLFISRKRLPETLPVGRVPLKPCMLPKYAYMKIENISCVFSMLYKYIYIIFKRHFVMPDLIQHPGISLWIPGLAALRQELQSHV